MGAMLARSVDDDIVVAIVVPTPWPPNPYRPDAEYLAYQATTAQNALDLARAQLGTDLSVDYVLHRSHSVASGLLEVVAEREARLVALGSSAAGAIGRVTLGGIAARVLHSSAVPMALAPRSWASGPEVRVRRVTVAFGRADTDGDLLASAASLAHDIGADLRVACFAVRPMAAFGGGIEPDAENLVVDRWVRDLERSIATAVDESGLEQTHVPVETVVGQGSTWAEAIANVSWTGGDILVVGTSDSTFSRLLLGSHASKIVRNSSVPVLLVPRSMARAQPTEA